MLEPCSRELVAHTRKTYTMNRNQRRKRGEDSNQRFRSRLAALRLTLTDDAPQAGDQALKLLEEYLEAQALAVGFRGEGGLGRYVNYLRGRDVLPDTLLERADGYTQVRNCLAHTYGLQVSPALAGELLDYLGLLFKQHADTAADLMTRDVQLVAANERLDRARDLMVRGGYGRLPVIDGEGRVIGLLTERDILIGLNDLAARGGLQATSVADAALRDVAERIVFLPPSASHEDVSAALCEPQVVAILVTPNGTASQRPVGIITPADLLYRV